MAKKKESDVKKDSIGAKLDIVGEILKEIPIYKDAIKPVVKAASKELVPAGASLARSITTICETAEMLLKPFLGLIWGIQQLEEIVIPALAERFKDKLHRMVAPPLFIAGPTLEA